MSRIILITALLATSAFAFSASTAVAQVPLKGNAGILLDGSVETCQTSGGGTRVKTNCELEEQTVVAQQRFFALPSLKPAELPNSQCEVATTTSYQQRNTLARVDGTIQVTGCTAAAGAFTVAVRVRDDAGDKVLDFRETWQRDADRKVGFTSDYPIGENAELINVRVRNLTCACADEPVAAADTPADSPPN